MKKLLLVICAMISLNIAIAQKNVLVENATGTWSAYSPSGIYYLDSLQNAYDNVIAIDIHASWSTQADPMAYDEYVTKSGLDNAPSANIGRRYTKKNTDEWFVSVQEEMNNQPKANVEVTTEFDETTRILTATITVTALENMEGVYTIGGVVTEDAVTGTTALYDQANVYANIWSQMGGFENMPDPIPYYRMAYDHVARHLLSDYYGETGFPATLAKAQTYSQTFSYQLPKEYDHNYVRVVGILLDENGAVDNAGISQYLNGKTNAAPKFTSIPVKEIPAGIGYVYNVYIHDTDDKNLTFSLEEKPEWLTLTQNNNKSARISGTPVETGEYIVVLKVSDGENETLQEYTIVVGEALGTDWETLGERAFTQVDYGFILGTCSYNGGIYTLLRESGFPALYRYNTKDKIWEKLASIMDEMGYDGAVAAGTDGVYVTYTIKSNNLIKVMKYANNEWTSVGDFGKFGLVPKIAVGSDNSIYIAFNDSGESNHYFVDRYKNGNWETMGSSYITAGGGSWARLALDNNDVPYVSWVDFFAGNKMYVSKLVGETWLQVGVGFGPVSNEILIGKNCQDIAVDANGTIYLAYSSKENEQLVVYCHNGYEWQLLGDNVADGTVKGIDVAIDSEQNFYVAYADGALEDKVSVMKYDGTEWSYVGQRGFTESATDSYMAMTLHNGSQCVVYTDIAMGSKASAKYYKKYDLNELPIIQKEYIINFNDYKTGEQCLNGQDNWSTHFQTAGTSQDFDVDYTGDGLLSPDESIAIFYPYGGSGVGRTATRKASENFDFNFKNGGIIDLEFDLFPSWWGAYVGVGYDADGDGNILQGMTEGDGGVYLRVAGHNNDYHPNIMLPNGQSILIQNYQQKGGWARYKMSFDFSAYEGAGSLAVFVKEFDGTNWGEWMQLSEATELYMALTSGSGDMRDYKVWDGIFFHCQGGTGGFDNILVRQFEIDDKPEDPATTSYNVIAIANIENAGIITGAGSYIENTIVTLTATPNSGYKFINWTENGAVVSENVEYTFAIINDRNLVANFELINDEGGNDDGNNPVEPSEFNVEVVISPENAGIITGAGSYMENTTVTLTATPNSGYKFINWTENGEVVSENTEYTFTITRDRNLIVNFQQIEGNVVTLTANPQGAGKLKGAGTYMENMSVTVTATANKGYKFINWMENNLIVSTDAEYSFNITSDRNLVANFVSTNCVVTATANPEEAGTVSGAGTYAEGMTVTLTATANQGYKFANWTENDVIVSMDAEYSFEVNTNVDLIANFISTEGIEELMTSIVIYPNPVNDRLFIVTEFEIESVDLYDSFGRLLTQVKGEKALFMDISDFNSGVYFVKIVTDKGEVLKRFVKK